VVFAVIAGAAALAFFVLAVFGIARFAKNKKSTNASTSQPEGAHPEKHEEVEDITVTDEGDEEEDA